jgi:dTDP-glucose 4,6-dehydratase
VNPVKLLVTGGLGFIGSNFIRYMIETNRDAKITNIDNLSVGSNVLNLKDIRRNSRYRFVEGDITNLKLLSKLVKDVEVVVNIAAETHVDRSIANPQPFLKSNTIGTFTVLEAIRRSNPTAKMVQTSTDEAYGDTVDRSFREDERLKPSSPYASSKAAADMFVLAYHRTYGLDLMITRCTNNFGPYQHPEKLVPKAIIRACLNLPIPVYGKGEQIRDWIYVLDHCIALNQVTERGRAGEVYNISAGNEMSNIRVVESILQLLGRSEDLVQFVEDRPGHDVKYSLDSSKIRSDLGWTVRYSFSEALKNTVEWYVKNESWWRKQASNKVLHPTPWKLGW